MSTNCTISIKNKDTDKFNTIYCHWDGYQNGVGRMLQEHYTDYSKVMKLISLGNISFLEKNIEPNDPKKHSYITPEDGCTVFYSRDRGEDLKLYSFSSMNEILIDFKLKFNYVFIVDKWFMF